MGIFSKIYLGLPQNPAELLVNGNFEDVTGDDFADWTETIPAFVELATNIDLELVTGNNFDDWTEQNPPGCTVEDEGVEVHGGAHSAKLTDGHATNKPSIWELKVGVIGKAYIFGAWVKGDYDIWISEGYPDVTNTTGTVMDWEYHTIQRTLSEGTNLYAGVSTVSNGDVLYFDDASLGLATGNIEDTDVWIRSGIHAVKITGAGGTNTQPYILQEVVSDPGKAHRFSFWTYGEALAYEIYDVTNSAVIKSGASTGKAAYIENVVTYNVPAGCVLLRVTFTGKGSGVVYLDDVSILEYGAVAWIENNDVMSVPAPSWGYGLGGKDPLRGVAETGIANFTFDNKSGAYSPENAARVTGFEEGMPVKIIISGEDIEPDWQQVADMEEGNLSDFDAVTPTWDKEVDAVADFDAETDTDGDLGNWSGAAHDGAVGLRVIFDDNTPAYGTMNADAVNKTQGVFTFYYKPATVEIEDTKVNTIGLAVDGGGTATIYLQHKNNGGTHQIRYRYRTDAPAVVSGSFIDITNDWHKITLMFKMSSGTNDGFVRLYIDDVLEASTTGIDNDAQDWDAFRIGLVSTNSTTFGGYFLFDTVKIDPIGAPYADRLAKSYGKRGMAIPIMNTTPRYCTFTDPNAETTVIAECNIDPNSLTMTSGDTFTILLMQDGIGFVQKTELRYASGVYYIRLTYYTDAPAGVAHLIIAITDAYHRIKIEWVASSGVGADDGLARLYIDDVLVHTITGIDNDTRIVDSIDFGAVSGLDASTYGIFYMDNCRWAVEIGQRKFIGTMVEIPPSSGAFNNPVTPVVAYDWMGYLNKQELGLQALLSDKRVDEVLPTLLAEFPNQPEATDFDTGLETFEVVFASDPSDSSMARMFAKLARNERGRIYSKGDGTLRFEKQGTRDGSQESAFTIDGTMSEFDVFYSTNNIYNTVALDIKTQTIDAVANKELFKVGQGIPIAAGQKINLEFNFTDEDTGLGVAGVDVVTPVAAPHFGSTRTPASDDMHGDLTDDNYQVGANSLTVDFENGAGSKGYLNEFTILGKRLTDYDRITITRKNQTSINQVGNQRYTNRLDLIEDPSRAESIADDILTDYAPSHTAGTRITILANLSVALTQALVEAEVSTKFTAIESITGISKDFYIDKIRYKQEDTLLWVTIDAEEV